MFKIVEHNFLVQGMLMLVFNVKSNNMRPQHLKIAETSQLSENRKQLKKNFKSLYTY